MNSDLRADNRRLALDVARPSPKIEFREIESGSQDFEKAYTLYARSFPVGELESIEVIEAWIRNDREGKLGQDRFHFHGAFLKEPLETGEKKFEAGSIIGLSSFHYMGKIKSGFLGYSVIESELRSSGIGSLFFVYLVKTIEEDAGGIGKARAVYMEIDKPSAEDPNTIRRLRFWAKNGVEPLDMDYEFPCLGEEDAPAQWGMMLSVIESAGERSFTDALRAEQAHPNGSTQQSLFVAQVEEAVRAIYESVYHIKDDSHPSLQRVLYSVRTIGERNGGMIPRKQIPGIGSAEPIFMPS